MGSIKKERSVKEREEVKQTEPPGVPHKMCEKLAMTLMPLPVRSRVSENSSHFLASLLFPAVFLQGSSDFWVVGGRKRERGECVQMCTYYAPYVGKEELQYGKQKKWKKKLRAKTWHFLQAKKRTVWLVMNHLSLAHGAKT